MEKLPVAWIMCFRKCQKSLSLTLMAEVSNWNSIRVNQSYSESFQNLFSNQFKKRFESRLLKKSQKSIWPYPIHTASIRTNLNHYFNLNESKVGMIRIENSVWINSSSDCFGLRTWFRSIRIDASDWCGIKRIKSDWFLTVFPETSLRIGSEWFWMVPKQVFDGSELDWIPIRNFRQSAIYGKNRDHKIRINYLK